MAKKFNAEARTVDLNTLRVQFSTSFFTSEQLRNEFKLHGIPSNLLFWAKFSKSGIIKQVDEDFYCFTTPEKPVYWGVLCKIYNSYQQKIKEYQTTYNNKKREQKLLENNKIQEALQVLRDCGFNITINISQLGKSNKNNYICIVN